jgi:hypothetical protein
MSWGSIGQAIFFLSVALLATVITIFVFASSLLGRAVESHAKEQERLRATRKKELDEQLGTAQKLLATLKEQCGKDDFRIDDAIKSLRDTEKRNNQFDEESRNLQKNYKVFTVQGGVIYPTWFFFLAMFFSALAWGLGTSGKDSFHIGSLAFQTAPFLYSLVPIALLLIGFGVGRLYSSLRRIREVAVTSEEAAMRREIEALKIAQRELEAEAAPVLELKCFEPDSIPIRIIAGDDAILRYQVTIAKGHVAENISVFIFAPPGFDFPKIDAHLKWIASPTETFPGHLCTIKEFDRLLKGLRQPISLTVKAPLDTGKFKLKHSFYCKGFIGGSGELDVEVVPKSQSVKRQVKPRN